MILLADFVILMLAVLYLKFSSIGCIMYADDLILLSPTSSVAGLHHNAWCFTECRCIWHF